MGVPIQNIPYYILGFKIKKEVVLILIDSEEATRIHFELTNRLLDLGIIPKQVPLSLYTTYYERHDENTLRLSDSQQVHDFSETVTTILCRK